MKPEEIQVGSKIMYIGQTQDDDKYIIQTILSIKHGRAFTDIGEGEYFLIDSDYTKDCIDANKIDFDINKVIDDVLHITSLTIDSDIKREFIKDILDKLIIQTQHLLD